MRRFFTQPDNITGSTVILSGEQAHHLISVLRLQPGQFIELFDGSGTIYHVEIINITGKTVEGRITSHLTEHINDPFPLTLAQGILKGKKMDLVVQKATELGVETLIPIVTQYSEQQKHLERRIQRWQRIMVESCKQCGRSTPMQITPACPMEEIATATFHYPILCWEGEQKKILRPEFFAQPGSILLLIGPEGGFHKREILWAGENRFTAITLGPLTLRAETAAIAATGIVQFLSRLQATSLQE